MRPVTIVGGGLAGLALGTALRQRAVPVTVLEAGTYPRHRVCGEFISGIREEALHALGIADSLAAAERPEETVWYEGGRAFFNGRLPERAYGVSRYFLDQALAERLCALGGELITGRRFVCEEAAEGTVLACGRPARAGKESPEGWLGLKAHFGGLEALADLEVHFGHGAYVGVTRVEEGWSNVTGLFWRGAISSSGGGGNALQRAVAAAGMAALGTRLDRAQLREGSLKGVNRFELGWQPGFGRGVRIGDAAAIIPPLTGNGMTMALQGALAALEPLQAWSTGLLDWTATERAVAETQRRLFRSRLRWAAALQCILMRPLLRKWCAASLRHGWVSFETLYRKVR
jgi:2-polyprenyl-6-methoxyphenol hydroxylase-like FAD-dependent oxidoreductase